MATLVFPSSVRDRVREQHAELRSLLKAAMTSTVGATDEDIERLTVVARELCERFRAHLAFEDEALKPVLAVLDSWGPERVMSLSHEHTRQREVLDRALTRFELEPDVEQWSSTLGELAGALLQDMDDEELGILRTPAMSASFLTIERR